MFFVYCQLADEVAAVSVTSSHAPRDNASSSANEQKVTTEIVSDVVKDGDDVSTELKTETNNSLIIEDEHSQDSVSQL